MLHMIISGGKGLYRFFSLDSEVSEDTDNLSPEDELLKKDLTARLYNALASLKTTYRDVLILRKINESSIKETAYILGWTETKVKSTLARAFAALKKRNGQLEGDNE